MFQKMIETYRQGRQVIYQIFFKIKWSLKLESSAFAFVCFEISTLPKLEISTLLKLENSCLLLFLEGLKFQALEGLKSNVKTDASSLNPVFA